MNVINNVNYKINTPTLADKSLHSFKSIKPEVQSSRLCRPDNSKINDRSGGNFYVGYSKDKDKILEMGEKIEKNSSKSLESKQNAPHPTNRK
jgi:hypothetical protein